MLSGRLSALLPHVSCMPSARRACAKHMPGQVKEYANGPMKCARLGGQADGRASEAGSLRTKKCQQRQRSPREAE